MLVQFIYLLSRRDCKIPQLVLAISSNNYTEESKFLCSVFWIIFKLQIFGIDSLNKSFEIYDLDTQQISRGLINKSMNNRSKNFTGPVPPEWREWASVAYFKDKLYYLGGNTNRVKVRRSNENPWNHLFRF